jgi:glycerate 2-kinase
MLKALGVRFLDANGKDLEDGGYALQYLDKIILNNLDPRILESKVQVLSDSTVPLTGKTGVSIMYSPGKGASKEMAEVLDLSLKHYASIVRKTLNIDIEVIPGSGSGGGVVSAAEVFLKADKAYGIDVVLNKINFVSKLKDADLVIVGEGQLDEQTIYNKAPIGVAKMANEKNIPVLAVCAKLGIGYEASFSHGISSIVEIAGDKGWCATNSIVNEKLISAAIEDVFTQIKINGTKLRYNNKLFFNSKKN